VPCQHPLLIPWGPSCPARVAPGSPAVSCPSHPGRGLSPPKPLLWPLGERADAAWGPVAETWGSCDRGVREWGLQGVPPALSQGTGGGFSLRGVCGCLWGLARGQRTRSHVPAHACPRLHTRTRLCAHTGLQTPACTGVNTHEHT